MKEKLKAEIDQLDEEYLELLYKIVRQFPHVPDKEPAKTSGEEAAAILQKIADRGGPHIEDPQDWQRETRKDRPLPLREE